MRLENTPDMPGQNRTCPDLSGAVRPRTTAVTPPPKGGVRSCPADLSGSVRPSAVEDSWPHGTGGRCGAVFAATIARRQADIARLGLRAATELWIAEGLQGSAIMAVLSEADWARMQRAS